MKKTVIRTLNNIGDKCKTYICLYKEVIIFRTITLIIKGDTLRKIMSETITRVGENYTITERRFSIKESTLKQALNDLYETPK